MHSVWGMFLGFALGVSGFLIAIKSEDGGNAWVGTLSGLIGIAGCYWAYVCYEKRLALEERGECRFSVAQAGMGLLIPLWLVMCLGATVVCLLRGLGLFD